jgi:short-subunit dehydrogenase
MQTTRKVFITGGSKGIGKELALQYAKDSEVFLFARNEIALNEICKYLKIQGHKANYFAGDGGNKKDVNKAVSKAAEIMGGIDIAILNAGISEHMQIREFDSDSFEKTHRINLLSNAYFFEALIPIMKHKNSVIAGVSSIADFRGTPGSSPYSSSKIAFSYLLESARMELKGIGINVVTVRFGFIDTDMIKKNKFPMPFVLTAHECARRIIEGIDKGKKKIQFPLPMVWLTNIAKIAPSWLYERAVSFRIKD